MMKNLRKLRLENNFAQKQVAERLNVRQNTYSQYETGARELSIDMLIEIAKLYNTSTDYVLGLTDEEDPYPRI